MRLRLPARRRDTRARPRRSGRRRGGAEQPEARSRRRWRALRPRARESPAVSAARSRRRSPPASARASNGRSPVRYRLLRPSAARRRLRARSERSRPEGRSRQESVAYSKVRPRTAAACRTSGLGRIEPCEAQEDRVADRLRNPHLRQRTAIPAVRRAKDVAAIDRLSRASPRARTDLPPVRASIRSRNSGPISSWSRIAAIISPISVSPRGDNVTSSATRDRRQVCNSGASGCRRSSSSLR